jgi:hypothetical protein
MLPCGAQDLTDPRAYYIGVMGARLARKLPLGEPVHFPVTAVLCGRRNNVPEPHSESPLPPPLTQTATTTIQPLNPAWILPPRLTLRR